MSKKLSQKQQQKNLSRASEHFNPSGRWQKGTIATVIEQEIGLLAGEKVEILGYSVIRSYHYVVRTKRKNDSNRITLCHESNLKAYKVILAEKENENI